MKYVKRLFSKWFFSLSVFICFTVFVLCSINHFINVATYRELSTYVKVDSFTIAGGTFDVDVKVVITKDTAWAAAYVQDNLDDTGYNSKYFDASAVTFYKYGYPVIIWFPEIPNGPASLAVANHEILHAVSSTLASANIPLSQYTEEVYAYQTSYISKQFYDKIGLFKK